MLRAAIQAMASCSATQAPVIEAVRVPPSAWSTSQSTMICFSPSAARSVTARSERPIRRWISWVRPDLLAGRGFAPRALGGGARQHAVFGRDPAPPLTLEPRRHWLAARRGAQHVGVAEADEAGAFGMARYCALEADGAKRVGRAF